MTMDDDTAAVPDRYRGVWVRTLLQTPTLRDDTTFVRWLQTSRWHADLRVPAGARPQPLPADLARQQGFSGVTTVESTTDAEVCAWHRRFDFQPPGPHPDAGRIVFDGADRLVETGIHADYLEVWERLPESTGRFAVLALPASTPHEATTLLLVAGRHAMRVRPRRAPWPADTAVADDLAALLLRHPQHEDLLDLEISYGTLVEGKLAITQSTLPRCEGSTSDCVVRRVSADMAVAEGSPDAPAWRILEWSVAGDVLA